MEFTLNNVLKVTKQLVSSHYVLLLQIGLLLYLLPEIIMTVVTYNLENADVTFVVMSIGLFIAYFLLMFWYSTSTTLALKYKKAPKLSTTLNNALSYIIPAIGISILVVLIIVGGLLLLIIPGIYFAVRFMFAYTSVIMDKKGILESLTFSKKITKGHFWKIFGFNIIVGLAFGLVMAIIGGVFGGILFLSVGGDVGILIFEVLSIIINVFITPIYASFIIAMYNVLKKANKVK